jgi:fumarylpyruvate hydrolase
MVGDTVPAWEPVRVPVSGGGEGYKVRRVFCVGRNYAEHAREMGHDGREPPFFFGKSAEAVTSAPQVPYPSTTSDLHHEVELVVAIGAEMRAVEAAEAARHVYGYAVGVDLTRRDLQAEAKRLARPWFLAKSWVGAAPLGPLVPAASSGHPRRGRIWLEVNGTRRQVGDLAEMIWSVDEVLAALSRYDALLPGDLVFTGTPAGVAAIGPGDRVRAGVDGLPGLAFEIAAAVPVA